MDTHFIDFSKFSIEFLRALELSSELSNQAAGQVVSAEATDLSWAGSPSPPQAPPPQASPPLPINSYGYRPQWHWPDTAQLSSYDPSIWLQPEEELLVGPPQGPSIQAPPPLLHEGGAQILTIDPSSSNVDAQQVQSKGQEGSNSSQQGSNRTRRRTKSQAPRKKKTRPLAFPAESNNEGFFGKFQVSHVGVQRYDPISYTRSGRILVSESQTLAPGVTGEGEIRGGRSYGHYRVGWTKESKT